MTNQWFQKLTVVIGWLKVWHVCFYLEILQSFLMHGTSQCHVDVEGKCFTYAILIIGFIISILIIIKTNVFGACYNLKISRQQPLANNNIQYFPPKSILPKYKHFHTIFDVFIDKWAYNHSLCIQTPPGPLTCLNTKKLNVNNCALDKQHTKLSELL